MMVDNPCIRICIYSTRSIRYMAISDDCMRNQRLVQRKLGSVGVRIEYVAR